jgi:hypothetical protein
MSLCQNIASPVGSRENANGHCQTPADVLGWPPRLTATRGNTFCAFQGWAAVVERGGRLGAG